MKAGMPHATSGRYHIQSDINMIPLIDVSLVLLIIFMVISPILVQSQLRVTLPKVTSAGKAEESPLKVEIAADGSIAFQGKIVTKEQLRTEMERALPPGNAASVLIQADKDTTFQTVVYVMDLAKQFKVQKLGVAVLPQAG